MLIIHGSIFSNMNVFCLYDNQTPFGFGVLSGTKEAIKKMSPWVWGNSHRHFSLLPGILLTKQQTKREKNWQIINNENKVPENLVSEVLMAGNKNLVLMQDPTTHSTKLMKKRE